MQILFVKKNSISKNFYHYNPSQKVFNKKTLAYQKLIPFSIFIIQNSLEKKLMENSSIDTFHQKLSHR